MPLVHGAAVHGTGTCGFKLQPLSITLKELISTIPACAGWGHQSWGHQVVCNCDNQVVVACWLLAP